MNPEYVMYIYDILYFTAQARFTLLSNVYLFTIHAQWLYYYNNNSYKNIIT